MFSKVHLKHILILALGFFWCSAIYLTQQTYLLNYCDKEFVNVVAVLYGSLSMALGILFYMILLRKRRNIKIYYVLFSLFALIFSFVFFGSENPIWMSLCLCATCLFGTAGFGVGYHFSLLALNVKKEYRGRVFAIGYGLGSIFTYLITLLPNKMYGSMSVFMIYVPVVILNMILVSRIQNVEIRNDQTNSLNYKKYFISLSIIVLLMSLLSGISTDVVSTYIFHIDGLFANTRIIYGIGLFIAGFLMDKNKEMFDIATLISFVFSLLTIVLLNQNISIHIVISLSYLFIGFFVVFRTLSFVNLYDQKKEALYLCGIGLMYSRIMEGVLVLFQTNFLQNSTLLIVIETVMLCIVLWVYFFFYLKEHHFTTNDKLKEIVFQYKLSNQEERVLKLLIQDLTKKEIASQLFLSVNTIKIHVTNIYKKTGMKKAELKEKCLLIQ